VKRIESAIVPSQSNRYALNAPSGNFNFIFVISCSSALSIRLIGLRARSGAVTVRGLRRCQPRRLDVIGDRRDPDPAVTFANTVGPWRASGARRGP